ncbi:hypothetical protein CLV62_10471 [Dysgonomonas alginatilytica]|uniref:Uncharacterized protein n=1 Tax=Dysgonomonas alginatilytica TaxID=1605892 RepID=A0A2V3PTF5_9BACT|nr:hypothetical protein [Dysgonomonas alginatilytica]PXV66811.1 hypothetical protein CLV62_10471 [Dysgonomonas alginatilytica]
MKNEDVRSESINEIELSREILDKLSVFNIIYAEFAEAGAMGCCGEVLFYTIENSLLMCYKTDLFKDENTYAQAKRLLFKYSENKSLNYYYGGVGNHVFINKDVSLIIRDEHFVYRTGNKEYDIYSSVRGVFISVVYAMQNPKN